MFCPRRTRPSKPNNPRMTAKCSAKVSRGGAIVPEVGFQKTALRGGIVHSGYSGPYTEAHPSLCFWLPSARLRGCVGPSLLNQWHLVPGLDPAPSDEPTSLGASAESPLRRAIVPPTLVQSLHLGTAVSVDGGHSSPGTFANKRETAVGLKWRVAERCLR